MYGEDSNFASRQTILEYARKVLQEKNLTVPILKVVIMPVQLLRQSQQWKQGARLLLRVDYRHL